MTMDPSTFHVVYVDRRAHQDRSHFRDGPQPDGRIEANGEEPEPAELVHNIQTLLSAFNSVSVCTSAPSCISILSQRDRNDPNPTLVLLDIPLKPQPEEDVSGHDGRHDSGISAGPEDVLYGLPLLKFVSGEIESSRMSSLVVPVAFLTESHDGRPSIKDIWGFKSDITHEVREMQCIEEGAWDVLRTPFSPERINSLYMHCYRARKSLQKTRKRSWVGVDEEMPVREAGDYAYLREKMVSELMIEICKPKKTRFISPGSQVRISPARAQAVKRAVGRWDFSAHDYSDEELLHGAYCMFEHALQMPEVERYRITPDRLSDFLVACRASYNSQIPYHNFRHVVDVLQAVFYFLLQCKALPLYPNSDVGDNPPRHQTLSHLISPLDAFTLLVVAIGHDVGHPGVNNAFLVTLKAPLAQVYNDRSVLESFHCAAFSQVLSKYWPATLDLRKMMIDMILATDMGLHFDYMGRLDKLDKKHKKDPDASTWEDKTRTESKNLLCALLIKCADISNVARKHDCSAKWAEILITEFSRQAGIEADLGIPSSLIAPPVTGSMLALAKSQVGFMNLFAVPLFEGLSRVLPEMDFSVRELKSNRKTWNDKVDSITMTAEEIVARMTDAPANVPQLRSKDRTPSFARRDSSTAEGRQSVVSHRPQPPHLAPVLGTVMMESDVPDSRTHSTFISGGQSPSEVRSGLGSPVLESRRSSVAIQHTSSGAGNATAVTVLVTQPRPPASDEYMVEEEFHEKRPAYQHSTEHLRADTPGASTSSDRPRSSPPDLGDASDHSCSKVCCATATITQNSMIPRRGSRFFKKVKLWPWRREQSEG